MVKKIIVILYLITPFHLLAANTIQYIEKFSGNVTDGILDKYHQSISIETYHEYSDLQLIITNSDNLILFSIIIEPKNWQIFETNSVLKYLDGEKDNSHNQLYIGSLPFMGIDYQAIDLIYKHDDFKKFIKSNELEIMVKDLVLKVNLKKLPLSKLKLK